MIASSHWRRAVPLAVWLAPGLATVQTGITLAYTSHPERPQFTGSWQKNLEKSDDPRELMAKERERMGGGPGGGFGGGPGGGRGGTGGGGPQGGGPGGGPPGGGPPGGGPRRGPGGPRGLIGPQPDKLEIEQSESELKLIAGEDVRIYYLDGEKHERNSPDGTKVEVRAAWKGAAIEVRQKTQDGPEVTESYEMSPDGKILVITRRFKLPRRDELLIIRTVYDSVEESE